MAKSRFFRFSLRTGLVVVTLICIVLAVAGRRVHRTMAQKRAVDAFAAANAVVSVKLPFEDRYSSGRDWDLAAWLSVSPWEVAVGPTCGLLEAPLRRAVLRCADLPDLEVVDIGVIDFEFDDECAAGFESLNELCQLNVPGSTNLTAFGFKKLLRPRLEDLTVDRCDLTGLRLTPSEWPQSFSSLRMEDCGGLTGEALAVMLSPSVSVISFDARDLTDDDLLKAQMPPQLAYLTILNAKSLTPRGLAHLIGPQMRAFHLYGADLSDEDVRKLPFPPGLAELSLSPCVRLTNASVEHIVGCCPDLRELRLRSPLLDDHVVKYLTGLRNRGDIHLEFASRRLSDQALANLSKHLGRSSRVIISLDGKVGYGFEQGIKGASYQVWHAPW